MGGVYSDLLQNSTDFGGRTSLLEEIYDEKYLTDRAQFVLNPYSNQLNWYWRIVNLNKSDAKKIIKAHTLYIFRVHSRYHYVKNVIETENGKPPRPGVTSAIEPTKTLSLRPTSTSQARTFQGKSKKAINGKSLKQHFQVGHGERDIPRGDDIEFIPHAKKAYRQLLLVALCSDTSGMSMQEVDEKGSPPKLRGGVCRVYKGNNVYVNFRTIEHDNDIINLITVYHVTGPLWQHRKNCENAAHVHDPLGKLRPTHGRKNGQATVTAMYVVVELEPEDILEVSQKNLDLDLHLGVCDLMVMRKDRVAGIDQCYMELEPYEE